MQPKVKALMTGAPLALERDAAALAALDLMIEHGFRHLPVVDGDRRVVGVVGFDDLRAAFPVPISLLDPPSSEQREALLELSVADAMTEPALTIDAHRPVEEAAQLMIDHRIGCLPVVDDEGHIDGIVTETDLLQALLSALSAVRAGERS